MRTEREKQSRTIWVVWSRDPDDFQNLERAFTTKESARAYADSQKREYNVTRFLVERTMLYDDCHGEDS